MFKPYVIGGWDPETWYPKLEPVIPRVYHKHLREQDRQNIYSDEELGELDAYFAITSPSKFKVFTAGGARIKLTVSRVEQTHLIPCNSKDEVGPVRFESKIKNTGNKNCFVRMHVAIPAYLDGGEDASLNFLHFNSRKEEIGNGMWNLGDKTGNTSGNYIASGAKWVYYDATIDGIPYVVYVCTYDSVLEAGSETVDCIYQVYLDPNATSEKVIAANEAVRSNTWTLKFAAECVAAADGVTNAFEAFADNVPGSRYMF